MKRLLRLFLNFYHHLSDMNLNTYASSAAFFVFLSLFPMTILLCSFLPVTPLGKSDLLQVVSRMPEPVAPMMGALIESLYHSTVGIVSVAALMAAWSAGKGVLALMRGLDAMNQVTGKRNYLLQRLIATFYTVVMIVVLILSLLLMVFGNVLINTLQTHLPGMDPFFRLISRLRRLFSWLVLAVTFTVIYKFVPNCRLRWLDQIPGALFTAVSWNLFSFFFSIYVENYNGMSVYGSLSTIVVIMLWLYVCMYLLLAGAYLNHYLLLKRDKRGDPQAGGRQFA